MKKLVIAATVVAALASAFTAQAASTGTITFNGLLTDTTCNVAIAGGSSSATITLPTVAIGQLTTATSTAGQTGFNMELTGCSGALTKASAYFQGGGNVNANGRLINTGSAPNVSLQLRDGSSPTQAVIKVGDGSQINGTSYVNFTAGAATLPYLVEYYAEGPAGAGVGTVTGTVVYSLQYM